MININAIDNYKGGFIMSGHANFAAHGSDIVCAACSSIGLVISRGLKKQNAHVTVSDGNIGVTLTKRNKITNELIELLYESLIAIEEQYPDFVKVEKRI